MSTIIITIDPNYENTCKQLPMACLRPFTQTTFPAIVNGLPPLCSLAQQHSTKIYIFLLAPACVCH